MRDLVSFQRDELQSGEGFARVTMQAPRANALEPELLTALHDALDQVERSGIQKVLITGGRNFSTGGDVARFFAASQAGEAETYSHEVVPVLQSLVLRMITMPAIFATALRGAATGGSAGMLFASDLAVAAPDTFVQPYYGVMGFAPDGGWAALLPDLIGGAAARSWLLANQRQGADDLLRLGLVQAVDDVPEKCARDLLNTVETGTALASKSIIWNDKRRAVLKAGLDAETEAFRTLIGRPETFDRMRDFLQPIG